MTCFDRRQWIWPLFAFLLLFLIYFPALHGPFILDDSHTISGNAAIQNPANIFQVWTSAKYYSSSPDNWGYRPLTATSNLLCWWVAKGATWPFHLFKILVFAGLCLVLFQAWRRLLPKVDGLAVAFGVLLFMVNPVNTQVLCYISATSTLLAGFFAALGLLNYLRWREQRANRYLYFGFLSLFLSMLAKEEGIVLMAIVPAVEIFLRLQEGQSWRKNLPWPAFFGFAATGLIGAALVIAKFEPTSDIARGDLSKVAYFITQLRAYLRYEFMFWLPIDLNADNLEFGFSFVVFEPRVIAALVTNLAIVGLAIYLLPRNPIFLLAVVWFYAAVSPSSSVVVLAEPVNDHRAFIAYFGLIGLNIVLLQSLMLRSQKWALVLAAGGILIYAIGTFERAHVWSSNELLWQDTVEKNPSSPRALNNLAVELMDTNRMKEALVLLDKCRIVGAQYGICYVNRATTLAALGRDAEAEVDYALGVKYDRTQVASRRHWAQFLGARGLYSRAIQLLQEADRFSAGQNLSVRIDLIQITAQTGNLSGARAIWNQSLLLFGDNPSLLNIGNAWGFTR